MAIDAAKELEGAGSKVRVVSMPSWELFEEQDQVSTCLPPVHHPQQAKALPKAADLSAGSDKLSRLRIQMTSSCCCLQCPACLS